LEIFRHLLISLCLNGNISSTALLETESVKRITIKSTPGIVKPIIPSPFSKFGQVVPKGHLLLGYADYGKVIGGSFETTADFRFFMRNLGAGRCFYA